VRLVGFIITMYNDARSPERQISLKCYLLVNICCKNKKVKFFSVNAMKVYRGSKAWIHSFITSVLDVN